MPVNLLGLLVLKAYRETSVPVDPPVSGTLQPAPIDRRAEGLQMWSIELRPRHLRLGDELALRARIGVLSAQTRRIVEYFVLPPEPCVNWSFTWSAEGISLRMTQQYSLPRNEMVTRVDVLGRA